jgi:hypothetical protein
MADQYPATQTLFPKRLFRRTLKRAGIAVLFLFVLAIPALRRLRRRVWIWTSLRAATVAAGAWLVSRFIYAAAGAGILALGAALVLGGLVFRARPQTASLDSIARQLCALVVVNGGSLLCAGNAKRVAQVHLFVNPDRVLALSKPLKPLLEIPFSSVRELSAQPVSQPTERMKATWSLDITWQAAELTRTRFCYEGVFAEHLARVAEATLRNVWKKELPVLKV